MPFSVPVNISIPDINTQVYTGPNNTTINTVSSIGDYLFFTGDGGIIYRLNINGEIKILTPPVATRLTNIVTFKNELYIGAQPGTNAIYKSNDNGETWTPVLSAAAIGSQTPLILATNGDAIVMGATGSVWRYSQDGSVWNTPVGITASISSDFPNALKWFDDYGYFIVSGNSKVVARSVDGINWTQITMSDPTITNVHTSAYFNNTLYLGTANGSLWTTNDFGNTVSLVSETFYSNYGVVGATDFRCRDMVIFKNRLFSAQRNGLQYSENGTKFLPVSIAKNTFNDLRAVTVFNNELWGAGNAGNIIKTLNQ